MRFGFRRLRRGSTAASHTQKRSASARILLVDPDLAMLGHHRRYSEGLKHAFQSLGFSVDLYAALRCPRSYAARVGAARVFSSSLYREAADGQGLAIRWLGSNAKLALDLTGALAEVAADDTIVVHTTGRDHLLGYYAWYVGLPKPRPRICLQIMLPPAFGASGPDQATAVELTGRSLRPWLDQDEARVMLAVDNRSLAEHLRHLFGRSFPVLPMPIWSGAPPERSGQPKDRPVLFVPGELRQEKGKNLIKSVAPRLDGKDFRLLVQSNKRQNWHQRPGLDVAPLPQDYAKYLQLMMDADAVILPYDPSRYDHRSSAAFIEALGCGKPVVVSAGTSMADELQRLGPAGVVMSECTPDALWEAIEELMRQLPQLRSAAGRIAPEIRARHTAPAFARQVLDWASGGRAAEPRPPEVALAQ